MRIEDPDAVRDPYLREIIYASAQEIAEHELVDVDAQGAAACVVEQWRVVEKMIPTVEAQKYPQWVVSKARPHVIHIHARLGIVRHEGRTVTKWYVATPEETRRCKSPKKLTSAGSC